MSVLSDYAVRSSKDVSGPVERVFCHLPTKDSLDTVTRRRKRGHFWESICMNLHMYTGFYRYCITSE